MKGAPPILPKSSWRYNNKHSRLVVTIKNANTANFTTSYACCVLSSISNTSHYRLTLTVHFVFLKPVREPVCWGQPWSSHSDWEERTSDECSCCETPPPPWMPHRRYGNGPHPLGCTPRENYEDNGQRKHRLLCTRNEGSYRMSWRLWYLPLSSSHSKRSFIINNYLQQKAF